MVQCDALLCRNISGVALRGAIQYITLLRAATRFDARLPALRLPSKTGLRAHGLRNVRVGAQLEQLLTQEYRLLVVGHLAHMSRTPSPAVYGCHSCPAAHSCLFTVLQQRLRELRGPLPKGLFTASRHECRNSCVTSAALAKV